MSFDFTNNKWKMYSDLGNARVENIVLKAQREKMTWPSVWKELYLLYKNFGHSFAVEPEVGRQVYEHLQFNTPYYFYGRDKGTTLFDVFPELNNTK